ncbi:MAG: S8 family serine peptidase [Bacteriovoracaceae bacterium]|nr:S8 family serine peptidase [Bacteriovoracaceae bacterium]
MNLISNLVGVLLTLGASSAFADSWILENPNPELLKEVESIHGKATEKIVLGDNVFYTISGNNLPEAQFASAEVGEYLQRITDASSAQPNYNIGLVKSVDATSGKKVRAPEGWHVNNQNYKKLHTVATGKDIIVAVLDTGVDYKHNSLKNHIWSNKNEVPGNGIDDDKNGYIDDVVGWDFMDNDNDPSDVQGHGTHCAGIIGADAMKGGLSMGIAPAAKIMPIRLLANKTLLADAALAIKYAVDNGAKVLSNSWRIYSQWTQYDPSPKNLAIFKAAIEYAQSKDVIFVAATGNERKDINKLSNKIWPVGYPGLTHLFGVASSDPDGKASSFTNYGDKFTHVAAPGRDIYSTIPGNRWGFKSGTSMATPLVAGAIALALSTGMSAHAVLEDLVKTAVPNRQWDHYAKSGGVINIYQLLK